MKTVKRTTDQTKLTNIAVEAKDWDVRLAAVEKLTDQILLAKIAVEVKWLDLRLMAIEKVIDQELLRQWAEKDPQALIRQAVVARIADDSFLLKLMPKESSAAVRAAIINALNNKDSLRIATLNAYHRKDREQALERLEQLLGVSHETVNEVVMSHKELGRMIEALARETDNSKLLTFALEGKFDVLRTAATRQLIDPAVLKQAALRADDREVLKILLSKLDDNVMLNQIALESENHAMRLAAAQKAGSKSWKEIFSAATAKGSTVQMLGDAIAAVSLFQKVQRYAWNGVQHACLNLIELGNESRIPEMVDLLEDYGDKMLTEDYLNCGQPDLDSAGRKWARRRGYSVSTGAGSHRATWGKGR